MTNYNKVILISIDALTKEAAKYFKKYFNEYYINYKSTNTWTLPGHFTMLSGKIISNLYYQIKIKEALILKNFLLGKKTIAYILKKYGFKTRAITGGGFLSNFFGWGWDWDEWLEAENSKKEWMGEEIKIRNNEFLFLHTYYVHNWFEDHPIFFNLFTKKREKLDEMKTFPKKEIINAKKLYINRAKKLAKKLSWIKKLESDTLVILTSDHGELFFETPDSFHHGNFALKNNNIFQVPLFLKTNSKKNILIKDVIYDFYLVNIILNKLKIKNYDDKEYFNEYSNQKYQLLENKYKQQLKNLSDKNSQKYQQIKNLRHQLEKIQSSKTYKIWQGYCKIMKKLGLKKL